MWSCLKAAEIGIAPALRLYKKKYPNVRTYCQESQASVRQELKKRVSSFDDTDDFNELPTKKRGRPLLLG